MSYSYSIFNHTKFIRRINKIVSNGLKSQRVQSFNYQHTTTLHSWTMDLTAIHQSYQMDRTTDVQRTMSNAIHI